MTGVRFTLSPEQEVKLKKMKASMKVVGTSGNSLLLRPVPHTYKLTPSGRLLKHD